MKTTSRSTLPALTRVISRKAARGPALLLVLALLLCLAALVAGAAAQVAEAAPISFTGQELLGRPTDTSMTIKIVPDANISYYYEYGTTSGVYTQETGAMAATAGQPARVEITNLTPNTHYYYRMQYTSDGGATWETRAQHSFWTQRAEGSTFTFDVTTDGHVGIQLGNASNWQDTLDGVAFDQPDFLVELGDTVAMDAGSGGSIPEGDTAAAEDVYKDVLPYFNTLSASSPIFLLPGNHEQQEVWHGTSAGDLPIMGKNAEKKFFLNPVPNAFYSGNARTLPALDGDELVQDYYSWTWGDALFVVINPYWTTITKPYTTSVGGGETDTVGSDDRWDWTLGLDQFNWLKSTLAGSDAKYKFVFSHQIVGGNSMSNQVNYGHGGVDSANFVEWGGYNVNGTTWAWDTERPGWGSQPIRQMMEANGVSAFFHGHDHQMAYESLNGMVYQATPSGSFTGSFGNYTTGGNSGGTVWADSTQGPGHLRVTVSPDEAEVEFVRYNQTSTAAYSYDILPAGEPPAPGTVYVDGAVSRNTADDVSSISVPHTTGTGDNRLMLVGVSWNCGTTDRTISSVTFTPSGGSATPLTLVKTQVGGTSGNPRYSAIYRLLNPSSGQSGNVAVTFSGSVSNGIVAGAANFAGVDQTTPLGTPGGAGSTATGTAPSVTLTGLEGDELVFDNLFMGGSDSTQTVTAGAGQTQRWNAFIGNALGAASTEQAGGSSVTMSSTASEAAQWAIAAVPIKPAATAPAFNSINVSAPSTTTGVAQGANLSVSWAPNVPVAAPAQFSVWLVSSGGSWTQVGTFAADNSASYTRNVAATVPVGTGYRVYVYHRATSGDAWGVGGLAAGAVNVTASSTFESINVSAPSTTTGVAQGANLSVSWAPNVPVAAPAQFSVWLVSSGGSWTQVGTFAADNSASYTRNVAASVPVGTGYRVYVYHRATSGDAWGVGGLAAGAVNVTASSTFESINVSAPSTTTGVAQGANLSVSWAPNVPVAAPAQFSVWLVSSGGSWTQVGTFAADNSASYTRNVAATVPVGTGYQVYVYHRASSGDAWGVGGLAAGAVNVTAPAFNAINVTAPSTTTGVAQGANLSVSWAPNVPVAAPAQFSVWLVSSGGSWTQVGTFAADNSASYTRNVAATVPVGTGYQVYVYHRATSGDAWGVGGLAAGAVNVTASSTFESINVSAPSTTTGVAQGANLSVSWAPNVPVAAPAQFSVWLVSSGGSWTQVGTFAADNSASYTRNVAATVPVGTGYRVYVYHRASSGDAWGVGGLAAGAVNVTP